MGSRVWALAMATRSTERTGYGVRLVDVRLVWWLLVCDPSVGFVGYWVVCAARGLVGMV